MLALIPVLLWDLLSVRADEYVSTWRDLGAATGLTLWFWRNVLVAATGWMVGVSVALAVLSALLVWRIPHILRLCG